MNISSNLAELIGAYIGDGYLYNKKRTYQLGFVGHPETDKKYFEHLVNLIFLEFNKKSKIKLSGRGIRIVVSSKNICNLFTENLGLSFGEGKCEKISIPSEILEDWFLVRNVLRGIVDTDGSVFAVKKPRVMRYPSIEITTCSKKLANQIRKILLKRGFRVAKIWKFKSKNSKRVGYRVPLNGKKNLKKWLDEIGFSNPYKLKRAKSYL